MVVAYTKEQTQEMIEIYQASPTKQTVVDLAAKYGKTERSIIGKLSREGVYRREVYKTKTGEDPVTKIEMLADIARHLDVPVEKLTGMDKTPKQVLKLVLNELNLLLGELE